MKFLARMANYALDNILAQKTLPDGQKIFHRKFRLGYRYKDTRHIETVYSRSEYDHAPIPRAGTVFDVGAHIGIFSLKASRAVGEMGKVVALEPDPANFRILVRNLRKNFCRNVIAIRAAAGKIDSKSRLFLSPSPSSHSLLLDRGLGSIDVKLYTIDSLRKYLRIERIDLLKIDAEGSELDILKGASNSLKSSKINRLAISVHPDLCSPEQISNLLESFGFGSQVFWHNDAPMVYASPLTPHAG